MDKYILIDVSGSMAEKGKKTVVRYLVYAIQGFLQSEYSEQRVEMYLFGREITPYNIKIDFTGKADSRSLKKFLVDKGEATVLLLGDGSYSDDIQKTFKASGISMLAVMIGSDCNKAVLQKIAGRGNVYDAVDLSACLNRFMNLSKG
jgi:uncharacterized protein YegL